jgi:hypothetical protein
MEDAIEQHPDRKTIYTQEKVAELVDKCPGTVFNWFAGVSRPDDASVLKMADYFEDPRLKLKHLLYWEPFFRDYYQVWEDKPLAEAAVSMLNEFNDVKNVLEEFLHNVGKGKLTPAIKQELIELHAAILGALNAKEQV